MSESAEMELQPGARARRILGCLRSLEECHQRLMKEKEAGGLDRDLIEDIEDALERMKSAQCGLFSVFKDLVSQELIKNRGGSLQLALDGSLRTAMDWQMLEVIVNAIDPPQPQQQETTSSTATAENPGTLERWIVERGMVGVSVLNRILDQWLEEHILSWLSN